MRFVNADRDAVTKAIVQHKFGPIYAEHNKVRNALGLRVYEDVYPEPVRVAMKALQDVTKGKALGYLDGFKTNANGWNVALSVEERLPAFNDMTRYGSPDFGKYPKGHPLADAIREYSSARKDTDEERKALETQVRATLQTFNTFEQAHAGWPAISQFLFARERYNQGATPPRQAVVAVDSLNVALDLPPAKAA